MSSQLRPNGAAAAALLSAFEQMCTARSPPTMIQTDVPCLADEASRHNPTANLRLAVCARVMIGEFLTQSAPWSWMTRMHTPRRRRP